MLKSQDGANLCTISEESCPLLKIQRKKVPHKYNRYKKVDKKEEAESSAPSGKWCNFLT